MANMLLNGGVCVPTEPAIAPLRLGSDYRDYPGRQHERFTEFLDPILLAGCYTPRIFHAPSTPEEIAGVPAGGYMEYALELPPGGFLLGFMHTTLCGGDEDGLTPGFRMNLLDVKRNYRLFGKPVSEQWFLNDILSTDPNSGWGQNYVLNPAPRLLAAPYPIAPPGQFLLEFWNMRDAASQGLQMTFVVAVPPEGRANGKQS